MTPVTSARKLNAFEKLALKRPSVFKVPSLKLLLQVPASDVTQGFQWTLVSPLQLVFIHSS